MIIEIPGVRIACSNTIMWEPRIMTPKFWGWDCTKGLHRPFWNDERQMFDCMHCEIPLCLTKR